MSMDLDLTIDTTSPSRIIEQLQNQPSLYAFYGEKFEDAKLLSARAKLTLEQRRAELAKKFRGEDPKNSEAKIEKMIFEDSGYVSEVEAYNLRKYDEGRIRIILTALEQRTEILLSISASKRQELRQFMSNS